MKAIIVDDEKSIRQAIQLLLKRWYPQSELVGETGSVAEAVALINQQKPDIVFLDIEIRGGTGFQVLQQINDRGFKLIFITAYNEFALQAIKMGATDYLLKPINEAEFKEAMERAIEQWSREHESMVNNWMAGHDSLSHKKMVLRTVTDIHIVDVSEIVRCEADNVYTTFFFRDGTKLLISKGLSEFEPMLAPFAFFRSHQSHLINLSCIKKVEKGEGGQVFLTDGTAVPLASRRRQYLLQLISKL
ncbi:MAG: response regulator transcription factor [Bacteroidales bacterium]|nr:response regulator transcription factor [Bacteroidales bacterium]